jgi:hypothetical protein
MGDTVLVLFHIGLLATVFFLIFNGHLRKRKKVQIDAALTVLWFALLVVAFAFFGWRAGIGALVLSLFYALISKPIAVQLARRILGYWSSFRPPLILPPIDLSDEALRSHHKETERRIIPIAQRPGITKVLSKNGMKPEHLREQFHFLLDMGLGAVARDVISNGRQLSRLLRLRRRNLAPEKIASRLIRWQWYVFVLCISSLDGPADAWWLDYFQFLST